MLTRPTFSVHHRIPNYCWLTDALIGFSTVAVFPARSEREARAIASRQYHQAGELSDDAFVTKRLDEQSGRWVHLLAPLPPEDDYLPF